MSPTLVEAFLAWNRAAETTGLAALARLQSEDYSDCRRQNAVLDRAVARKLLSTGHANQAFELVQQALRRHPEDLELHYLHALALARGGNRKKAQELVKQLLERQQIDPKLDEPVTTPGCAYTSEQFAAVLAVEQNHDFICEYVGIAELPKEFGPCPLYRLANRLQT